MFSIFNNCNSLKELATLRLQKNKG